ncbi:MAG: hypothetical protein IPG43_07620 [Proteobacteria bacterium]|nr:hypothetical protein [Pseudomonadota bacterium]
MGLCKCRQCGEVAPAKAWSAAREPACPHCGHGHFSISFPAKSPPPASQPRPVDGTLDAHGRRRKSIRLEDLTKPVPAAPGKPGFRGRMQALRERAAKADDEE